jgi:hypothetical protein
LEEAVNGARVVHVKDKVPGAVYVGRANARYGLAASPFANPFRVGTFSTRAEAIEHYRRWLTERGGRLVFDQLPALRGKPLACWCRREGEERTDDNACHADILVALLDRYSDDELRGMALR